MLTKSIIGGNILADLLEVVVSLYLSWFNMLMVSVLFKKKSQCEFSRNFNSLGHSHRV
jgi:hypothetical protein